MDLASPSERLENAEIGSHQFRLSWDSFARALPPTSPSRVHSSLTPEFDAPFDASTPLCREDTGISPRQLASTRSACSALVVSHHFDGLLRVTASDVLQSEPARVRCVAGGLLSKTDGRSRPTPEGIVRSQPAAPPLRHLPKQTRGFETPFPQRGHPTKNLERQQPTTSLDATVPSCGCRPPGADPKVLPRCLAHFRAFIRRRLWTLLLAVASSLAESASSHGFLYLQCSLRRPKPTGRGAETPSAAEASDTLQM
jgi:hypothetical protein